MEDTPTLRTRKACGSAKENDAAKDTVSEHKFDMLTPGTQTRFHRIWTRTVFISCLLIVVYMYANVGKETKLALQREQVPFRFQKRDCSPSYLKEIKKFPHCIPPQCGRFITDVQVTPEEVEELLKFAQKGIQFGGSDGGASILDLHSGALSKGQHFINIFDMAAAKGIFTKEFTDVYESVTEKIKKSIATNFQIQEDHLYLTSPTFFSRINNITAKTVHDEYWHSHVDQEQYESFHYTSLVYLNDFNVDFEGGRFVFMDGEEKKLTKVLVEPKAGRVNAFTSGHENVHQIEKVIQGTRFALTISFTCNPKHRANPHFKISKRRKMF